MNKSFLVLALAIIIVGGIFYFTQNQSSFEVSSEDGGPIFTVATSTGATYFTITADGKVGIGTEHPVSALEVAGQIRLTQKSTEGCSATTEGVIAYNPDNKSFWGCNGFEWRQLDK